MVKVEATLSGDFMASLDSLLEDVGESVLRTGLVAGGRALRDQAIANAPQITGVLKNNIIVKHVTEESDGAKLQTYLVTIRKGDYGGGDAFYGQWVESGHKFVKAKPESQNWKAHRAIMQREYGSSTVPARPFMRPAWESLKGTIFTVMRERMASRLAELKGAK